MDSRKRDPVYTWPVATVLLSLAVLGLTAAWPRRGALWDLGSFLLSGHSANHGVDPYSLHCLEEYRALHDVTLTAPNLNPPVSIPIFQALDALPPSLVLYLWFSASLAILVAVVAVLARRGPGHSFLRNLWPLSSAGLWMTLALGQIYAPLVALCAVAHQSERRQVLSGVSIGIVASFKPNFLVWPGLLLLAGHVKVALVAVGTFGLLWGTALVLLGQQVYESWFQLALTRDLWVPTNMSLYSWLDSMLPDAVVLVIAVACALALSIATWRWRPTSACVTEVAVCTSLALAPVAWVSYSVFLLPPLLTRRWSGSTLVALALLSIPANWVYTASPHQPAAMAALGAIYPLALLILLVASIRRMREERRPAPTP